MSTPAHAPRPYAQPCEGRRRCFACQRGKAAWTLAAAAALLMGQGNAMAFDHASLALGRAAGATAMQGAIGWADPARVRVPHWLAWTGAQLRLELTASVWRGHGNSKVNGTLLGLGVQPLLRWTFAASNAGQAFVDFGTGPRLWSGTRLGGDHRFGTAFEFGTVLGAGLRREHREFFIRYEHTSNAGIRKPNPGIDFVLMGVSWQLGA